MSSEATAAEPRRAPGRFWWRELAVLAVSPLSFVALAAALFMVPVLEKAQRGRPAPGLTQLLIDATNLARADLLVAMLVTSLPMWLCALGVVSKGSGHAAVGRALLAVGLGSIGVVIALLALGMVQGLS